MIQYILDVFPLAIERFCICLKSMKVLLLSNDINLFYSMIEKYPNNFFVLSVSDISQLISWVTDNMTNQHPFHSLIRFFINSTISYYENLLSNCKTSLNHSFYLRNLYCRVTNCNICPQILTFLNSDSNSIEIEMNCHSQVHLYNQFKIAKVSRNALEFNNTITDHLSSIVIKKNPVPVGEHERFKFGVICDLEDELIRLPNVGKSARKVVSNTTNKKQRTE